MRWSLCVAMVAVSLVRPTMASGQDPILPGDALPGMAASVFAPDAVSTTASEYGVTTDQHWSELYFTRVRGEHSVVMTMHRVGETWSSATAASFSGRYNDSHPWLSPDGERLYFVSRRPGPGASEALNVWFVERSPEGWTSPATLGSPVIDQTVHAPTVSSRGTIYATGLIQLRTVDGRYLPAERLAPDVTGSHPTVAPDEDFLVFSARRQEGFGGKDLYVIFRQADGSWTGPANLGSGVNTSSGESSPTLSSDGRSLFFSRGGNVWWVDSGVIEAVRPGHIRD